MLLRAAAWVPLIAATFAVRALLLHGLAPLNTYDEGLVLTGAYLMSLGEAPYADFYTNYPPGVFHIARTILFFGWPTIWTMRALGFAVRIASALGAACLVAKARNDRAPCAWTFALVLILQECLGLPLAAYTLAILTAECFALAVVHAPASPAIAAIVGALFALTSYFRHDVFMYAVPLVCALELVAYKRWQRPLFTENYRQLGMAVLGAAISISVLWLPILLRSGWEHPFHDLYYDQRHHTGPSRWLPMPALSAFCVTRLANLVVFVFAGAASAAISLGLRLRTQEAPTPALRALAAIVVFAIVVIPQAMYRTDTAHVAYGIPFASAGLGAALGWWVRPIALVLAVLPSLAQPPELIDSAGLAKLWTTRDDNAFIPRARQLVVRNIDRNTRPNEPVFVGCTSHRKNHINAVDLLYLARRPNATRRAQFDPGLVTTEAGQRDMIADLERTRPRLAVRDPWCVGREEPNLSRVEGASLLDDYLEAHYMRVATVAGFGFWLLKSEVENAADR
jgi:hypothetical protein